MGSCGGLDSRSLSWTLSRPSLDGEEGALPESLRPGEVGAEGSREAIIEDGGCLSIGVVSPHCESEL
jgi:hypothetical protein